MINIVIVLTAMLLGFLLIDVVMACVIMNLSLEIDSLASKISRLQGKISRLQENVDKLHGSEYDTVTGYYQPGEDENILKQLKANNRR